MASSETQNVSQSVTLPISANGQLGSISVSTMGIANLDYTLSSGGTCSIGSTYTAGQSCTVNVVFQSNTAGQIAGAIVLTMPGGAILGTAYVSSVTHGPQIVFGPGIESQAGTGWNGPHGVAVDGEGNLYVADTLNDRVAMLPVSGTTYGSTVQLETNLNHPSGVAVDGAGNLFYADTADNAVIELPWNGSNFGAGISIPTGLSAGWLYPQALTVDGAGSLYVADSGNARVLKVAWTGSRFVPGVPLGGTIWGLPTGVAVDGTGNVYVADAQNDNVTQIPWNGSAYTAPMVIDAGYSQVESLAADSSGNLYVADTGSGVVIRIPWTGSAWGNSVALISGLISPKGIAVDLKGNVYVTSLSGAQVIKLDLADGPSLTFPTATPDGTTDTADGPLTASVFNIGNQPLLFTASSAANPDYPPDFPENNADSNLCASETPLEPGTNCDVSANFVPSTGGINSANVLLSGNAATTNGMQAIQFVGTATQAAPTVTWPMPAAISYGTPIGKAQLNATASAPGTFLYSPASGTVLAAGTQTLSVSFISSNATKYGPAQASVELTVNPAPQSINFPQPASPVTYGVFPLSLSATGGVSGNAVTFNVVSGPGALSGTNNNVLTVTGAGTIVIAANQAGSPNFAAAAQVTRSVTVIGSAATLIAPSPGTALSSPSVTFTWTTSSGAAGYMLTLGTTGAGSSDLFNTGQRTVNSWPVSGLPTNGETIYARLITYFGAYTVHNDTTFTAPTQAALTAPLPGSLLSGSSATFTWTAGIGATGYSLWLGSTGVGSNNLFSSGALASTSAASVPLPVNGDTLYVRLLTSFNGALAHLDYTFTAATLTGSALKLPLPGTTLTSSSITFAWSPANGATSYALSLGSLGAGSNNLFNTGPRLVTSWPVSGLPLNGETIYARLTTNINGSSVFADFTYTSSTLATIISPAPGSLLAGPSATFSWTSSNGATAYSLSLGSSGVGSSDLFNTGFRTTTSWPVTGLPTNGETVYARLTTDYNGTLAHADFTFTSSTQATLTSPTPGSVLPGLTATFAWSQVSGASGYALWVGSTGVGSNNLFSSGNLSSTSVATGVLPVNGETIYVRLLTAFNGTSTHDDYTYTAATFPGSVLSSPVAGAVLAGPTVPFSWTAVPGATSYELSLGTTGSGSSNLFSTGYRAVTSWPVNGLPLNGETIYARLFTSFNGSVVYTDATVTAASQAVLTSPAPGSPLTGSVVTFDSTIGSGSPTYALWLGSKGVGSSDLYSSGSQAATAFTAGNLPTNGEMIYARILTNLTGTWVHADYTYLAASSATLQPVPIAATDLQARSSWEMAHDLGTTGSSIGATTVVASPSVSGSAREFATSFTDYGGERYYVSFGADTSSTNFVYEAMVWIAAGSSIANLEMDMNQVMSNGQTVIYGVQCDGYSGTWDYTENAGTPSSPLDEWVHSSAPCNPSNWSTNQWHSVLMSYSRDENGVVTYNSFWLDGVEATINATVPSAFALGWGSTLLTNLQIDGPGSSGSSTVYLDDLSVYRW